MIVKSVLIFIFALIITSDARFRFGGSRSSGASKFGSGSRGSHSSSSSYGHSSSNRGNTGSSIFGSNNHHATSLSYPRQHESSIFNTNKNTPSGISSFGNHNTGHHTPNTHTNSFTPSAPSAPTQHIGWKPPPSSHLTQTHTNPYRTQSQSQPKPFHTQTHSTQSPFSHSGYGHPHLPNSGSTVQNIGWNQNLTPKIPAKNPSYPTQPHGQITNANSWQTNAHVPSNTHSGSKPPYPTQIHHQNNMHSPHVPSAPPASNIGWKVTPTHVGSGTGVSTANHGMQVSVKKITIFDSKHCSSFKC